MFDTQDATVDTSAADIATVAAPVPAAPVVLTKEEKLARLDEQIKKLQEKRYNIENDIVAAPKAPKEVVLPAVGDDILFNHGRRTATTEPSQKLGKVVAIKAASVSAEGKKLPAQLKVSIGEGFDQEFVVIYPAQIVTGLTATE